MTRAHFLTMSFILRDPFFDGFEDVMTWPLRGRDHSPFALEDDKSMAKRVRRDVITPFSGFGRMDMTESDKAYQLCVDIPGMEKKDIKISTQNNVLVIEGERKEEEKTEKDHCHFMERHYGSFRREVSVPANANAEAISAVYDKGVLKLTIPKVDTEVSKKTIEVSCAVCSSHSFVGEMKRLDKARMPEWSKGLR